MPSTSSSAVFCTKMAIQQQVPVKKYRNVKNNDKLRCAVCGDRPTGYHYKIMSCNGCKTFFRRTILGNRTFKCSKGGNCHFDKKFRCSCRACRFAKCVSVGMDSSAIQYSAIPGNSRQNSFDNNSPEEGYNNDADVMRGQLVEYRKQNSTNSEIDNNQIMNFDRYQWDESTMKIVSHLLSREEAAHRMRRPNISPIFFNNSLREILKQPCLIGLSSVNSSVKTDEKLLPEYVQDPFRFWMGADKYLQCEYAKAFEPFNRLNENDQLTLLSHVGAALQIATQSYYSYVDKKSDILVFPDGLEAVKEKIRRMKSTNSQ